MIVEKAISQELVCVRMRVSQNENFRQELAEKLVQISTPGYSRNFQGWYKVDPVGAKIFYCNHNQFSIPEENLICDLEDCFDMDDNDFSPEVSWKLIDISFYGELVDSYLENEGEEREENGDIPEWISIEEVCQWGLVNSNFQKELQEIEKESYEQAINFALENIKDEIILEI